MNADRLATPAEITTIARQRTTLVLATAEMVVRLTGALVGSLTAQSAAEAR